MRSKELWVTNTISNEMEWKLWFEHIPGTRYIYFDKKILDYSCDSSSGQFMFNGTEMFCNFTFPHTFKVTINRQDSEPYLVLELPETAEYPIKELYRVYERRNVEMRVEKVETVEDTSEYWWEEEEQAYMCLFPKYIQRVTFTILSSKEDTTLEDYVIRRESRAAHGSYALTNTVWHDEDSDATDIE
jgi:hypothetical protein